MHKDTFLEFVLKEQTQLFEQFQQSCRNLYFYFNLESTPGIDEEQFKNAIKFIAPEKANEIQQMVIPGIEEEQPYHRFLAMCKQVFKWKQEFIFPQLPIDDNIKKEQITLLNTVSSRWNTLETSVIDPAIVLFQKLGYKGHDSFAINKVVAIIRDYVTQIQHVIIHIL